MSDPSTDQRRPTDQSAVADARARFRAEGPPQLEADDRIRPHLADGEGVVSMRRGSAVDRRQPPGTPGGGIRGDLYLTSSRIVLIGVSTLAFGLDEIVEAAISSDRLILLMSDKSGVWVDVERPGLFLVELSAARVALRSTRGGGP